MNIVMQTLAFWLEEKGEIFSGYPAKGLLINYKTQFGEFLTTSPCATYLCTNTFALA